MHPETLLAIMAAFTGFLLKTSLGFCVCWCISKVLISPNKKFLVWFGFLFGAGCYWLWLAVGFVPHRAALAALQVPAALAMNASLGQWQLQSSWALPLSIALRGLGGLYLIVLAYLLFARIKKQVHLRWILRFAYRAPEAIEKIFHPITEDLDAGNAQLLMLSGIHSPATFGWIRPIILLPPFCLEQDGSELGVILRHELQHIRRRDFVFNTIASLCRALLFFHPAMWYAMRRLELEGELACDLAVVGDSPERRAAYAECLVRFARLNVAEGPRPWNLDFAGPSVQLKVRVRSVLAGTQRIPSWVLGLRVTLGVLLFAGFLGIAPSLWIVLSYDQHRIVQPVVPTLFASRTQDRLHGPAMRTSRAWKARQLGKSGPKGHITSAVDLPDEAVAATQIVPRKSDAMPSSEMLPTLKRRNAASGAEAPASAPNTTILLSNEPSAHGETASAQSRAVAAVITTVGEVGRIAGRGRDKGDH